MGIERLRLQAPTLLSHISGLQDMVMDVWRPISQEPSQSVAPHDRATQETTRPDLPTEQHASPAGLEWTVDDDDGFYDDEETDGSEGCD